MGLWTFIAGAVIISFSGIMSPGPMTAATVGTGSRLPGAGSLIAVGHGIVELPLMAAIFFGLGPAVQSALVRAILSTAGGAFMLVMAAGMFRDMRSPGGVASRDSRSPLMAGIVLSAANPYFLVWWASVGAALLVDAARFGLAGFALFAACHWLCDFLWYSLLSLVSFKGGNLLGSRFNTAVAVISGAALLFFGAKFVFDGIKIGASFFHSS